jgi:hypothetical protein
MATPDRLAPCLYRPTFSTFTRHQLLEAPLANGARADDQQVCLPLTLLPSALPLAFTLFRSPNA